MLLKKLITRKPMLRNCCEIICAANMACDGHKEPPTMDDLPEPEGNWQEQYDNNNRTYNAVLISGFGALVGTLGLMVSLGKLEEWNFIVPSLDN